MRLLYFPAMPVAAGAPATGQQQQRCCCGRCGLLLLAQLERGSPAIRSRSPATREELLALLLQLLLLLLVLLVLHSPAIVYCTLSKRKKRLWRLQRVQL